jgi:hypothetical protein
MPKNKRPAPRKTELSPEEKTEALAKVLCDLALDLVEQEDSHSAAERALLAQKDLEFHKLLKKTLNQQKDDVLYEAIDRATYEDIGAYHFLRNEIAEASSVLQVRRDNAPTMEINAFAIPIFVRSTGGLRPEQQFQDQAAFEELVASFAKAQLESPKAKVVLIQHAYDVDEIDRITYCHLSEMLREAYTSMTDKKIVPTPALDRSISTTQEDYFGPDDAAVELRFLLGFALKRADDPFYKVPVDEAMADNYFDDRMQRYQEWTRQATPLVQRCLAPAGTALELNFLYQDLFHDAKEQGLAEYFMLQTMTEINQALAQQQLSAGEVRAVVAPADELSAMQLRVSLFRRSDGSPVTSADKPLDLGADLVHEIDDICDALATIGLTDLSVAARFDKQGQPVEARPYQPN